jgi:hypothetical protein
MQMRSDAKDFARVIISMGEYMGEGKTFEEAYRHALTVPQSASLRSLWEEMLAISEEKTRSPLEALNNHEKEVGSWLLYIFYAGAIACVESIWIRGGQTFLEVQKWLEGNPHPSSDLQGRAFLMLTVMGIRLGLQMNVAVAGSLEIIDNPKLKNFLANASQGLAPACRKYPDFFPSSLVDVIEKDERSSAAIPYDKIINILRPK